MTHSNEQINHFNSFLLFQEILAKEDFRSFLWHPSLVERISRVRSVVSKMATKTKISASLVDQFVNVTGATKAIAKSLLEACNGNLEMAVEMHLDSCEDPETQAASANSESANGTNAAGCASRASDDVRAPIPQTRGILVEPYQAYPTRRRQAKSVFDAFRDFQAEARQQEAGDSQSISRGKKKTLHDLFRPPIDLLHKGTFDTAKIDGQEHSRWLLVNVQDVREFPCQQLNRDVWSNEAVRNIIKEHFVLWQVYRDSNEGERFIQFYHVTSYPYLAVLDPRTGEKMIEWGFMDAQAFCECATAFVLEHPSLEGETPPAKKRRSESIVDASEDSQLRAAIAASLACTTSTKQTNSSSEEDDEDFADLEFSDSDSDVENPSPKKNASKQIIKTEKKRDLNSERTSDTCKNESKQAQNEHLKTNKSSTNKNNCKSTSNSVEKGNSEAHTNAVDSSTEEKVESSNDRSQEQAGPMCNIMVRFPNGSRTHLSLSAEASLKDLVLMVQKEGYPNERFELVTNFPRRKLTSLDFSTSLKSAGLFPQETVFVQER
ncbi:UBX domain-containing protein 7-like [Montipora foliosa]|uniref:UBX domain-containing protein 7-like n=1 Tax=Montipora foliosa TaxID=591990 RepID=UPI0035F1C540